MSNHIINPKTNKPQQTLLVLEFDTYNGGKLTVTQTAIIGLRQLMKVDVNCEPIGRDQAGNVPDHAINQKFCEILVPYAGWIIVKADYTTLFNILYKG